MIPTSIRPIFVALLAFFFLLPTAWAIDTTLVQYTDADGDTIYLEDDRRPALYTGNFGDCLGSSAINVTHFDAAYYKDNMTVLFHLAGNSAIANESLMLYLGVYAYGENRFDITFNPCDANINSLCPLNASVPIQAYGIIPVAASDVSQIPPIALTIPDFEGQVILRIFANSTESEIGCYSAVLQNGNSFSHPSSVGTVLGIFTLVAVLASFLTAIYGDSIPVMRNHYAHSLSVFVVFAVFQHIFFTGALSMNWPSVLVAWWSNFAWAGGMIYSGSMQASINHLIGNNVGNTSQVGAAASGSTQESLGGGYDISQIYRRDLSRMLNRDLAYDIYKRDHSLMLKRDVISRTVTQTIQRRELANSSSGSSWYGQPVGSGLPLPGNYSGFAGTLAQEGIRVSNAFMTGFLWLIILLVIIVAAVIAFKWTIEAFVVIKLLRKDRLTFFRKHWMGYTALAALRTLFIAFFMMMLLTMFQFSYGSPGGVKGIAAVVFIIFFVGISGLVAYACISGLRSIKHNPRADQTAAEPTEMKSPTLFSKLGIGMLKSGESTSRFSIKRLSHSSEDPHSIHEHEEYVKKFGWLSARFRLSKWWFFAPWILYEFVRACFYAGASGHPMTQVFGLLVVEILAFAGILWARPYEGKRLNLLVVYLLGFSKVATVALSAAFDITFNLPRITTTVIGIVIIVIQGVLTIVTMVAIVVGAISSYMSLTRNREDFRPRKWAGVREKYFKHINQTATDLPPPPPPVPEEPKGPYFSVSSVRRIGKIEDEDPDFAAEIAAQGQERDPYAPLGQYSQTPAGDAFDPYDSNTPGRRTRAASRISVASNTSLPFGARSHRPSWTSRDFNELYKERLGTPINMNRNVPDEDAGTAMPTRAPLRSATLPIANLRPMVSVDSLRVGGDMSTRDTIGNVPSPSVRPRSGTFNGRTPSRGSIGTPTPAGKSVPAPNLTNIIDLPKRDHRTPLTPAEERDEEFWR